MIRPTLSRYHWPFMPGASSHFPQIHLVVVYTYPTTAHAQQFLRLMWTGPSDFTSPLKACVHRISETTTTKF